MIDLRQTEKYKHYMESIGWKVERIANVNYFIRPFWFLGSFMKIQRLEKVDFKVISKLQKKHKVFQTIIEPHFTKATRGRPNLSSYKQASPFLPSKTIYIDLKKSQATLLKEMHQKTRYNIKVANKNKVEVKETDNLSDFIEIWKKAKFSRKVMSTKDISELAKAFGKDTHLLMAYKKEGILGGVLCIHAEKFCYYMYAATTDKGKKLFAPTLLVWEQILLAKKLGCKTFDFEGIYDERFPIKGWEGFSKFKKGFGGKEISFIGAFKKGL